MPTITSLLDAIGAGGSANITERRGSGALARPYILDPVKSFLSQRGAVDISVVRAWLAQRGAADAASIKTFLTQRGVAASIVNEVDSFVQGLPFLNEMQSYAMGTMAALLNDLDAFAMAVGFPTSQLLSASTSNGLNLHATIVSDVEASLTLSTDLDNSGTGKGYAVSVQILLDRDTVQKINNFSWFLLTLMP